MKKEGTTQQNVHRFTVVIEPDPDGGYVVCVPALPGCVTQGDTIEEASANAKEAIEGYLLTMKDMGEEIPYEPEGTVVISITTDVRLDR